MKERYLLILLIIAMFLWGSSWPSSKILTTYADASVVAFWRFFFVFLGTLFVIIALKIPLKINKSALKWVLIAAFLNALYTFIFFISLRYGFAGKGGVLVTTMIPMFSYLIFIVVLLFSKNKLRDKISKYELLGLFLGLLSGLCLLNLNSIDELFGRFNILFLSCAFIWALIGVFTKKAGKIHPLSISFYINLISLLLFSWVLFDEKSLLVFTYDFKFWANLLSVAFLSTVIGTSIYYYAIFVLGSIKANSFILITPASALICSYFLLNEKPNFITLIGCCLSILAIFFMNIYSKK